MILRTLISLLIIKSTHSLHHKFVLKSNVYGVQSNNSVGPTSTYILANTNEAPIEPEKKSTIIARRAKRVLQETLSGLVVSVSTLPPSAAYSTVIGISPLLGIWSSFIVGIIVALLAGGPGIIAGAAGVIAIPIARMVHDHGLKYMCPTLLLASIFEMLFGIFKLAKYSEYISEPVITGFLNSFSLFLCKSQIKTFMFNGIWLPKIEMLPTILITLISFILIRTTPYFTKTIPASVVGLLVSTLVTYTMKLPVKNLADISGPGIFTGGLASLPPFTGFPKDIPFTWETARIIVPTAMAIMIISIVETIFARRVACTIGPINTRHRKLVCPPDTTTQNILSDRAVMALGVGNAVSSLFGGFGGCSLIPNTILNNKQGGRSYVSSVAYAMSIFFSVVLFAPFIGKLPVASLAGLMLNVAISVFDFDGTITTISEVNKDIQGKLNLLALLVTFGICYQYDMAMGVLIGTLITNASNIYRTLTLIPQYIHQNIEKIKLLFSEPSHTETISTNIANISVLPVSTSQSSVPPVTIVPSTTATTTTTAGVESKSTAASSSSSSSNENNNSSSSSNSIGNIASKVIEYYFEWDDDEDVSNVMKDFHESTNTGNTNNKK